MAYSTPGTCETCLQTCLQTVRSASASQDGWLSTWLSEFCSSYKVDPHENLPYVGKLINLGDGQQGHLAGATQNADADLVPDFMAPSSGRFDNLPTKRVERFCYGANLKTLKNRHRRGRLPKIALFDERTLRRGVTALRRRGGPLTAYELYEELLSSAMREVEPFTDTLNCMPAPESSAGPSRLQKCPPEVDIADAWDFHGQGCNGDQNFIFINNLDRWAVCALIGTVSNRHAPFLRTALDKHLDFEPFMRANLLTNWGKAFEIAFHLPYFVWCDEVPVMKDTRQRDAVHSHGRPMRRYWDVPFLSQSGMPATIQQAQFSCIVMGMQRHWWTALSLSDNYYDDPKLSTDSVFGGENSYSKLREVDQKYWLDPAVLGQIDIEHVSQDPLQYILSVLRHRITRNRHEHEQILDEMKGGIRRLQDSQRDALFTGGHRWFFDTGSSVSSRGLTAVGVTEQVGQLTAVCRYILQTLRASIVEYETFVGKFGALFDIENHSGHGQYIATAFEDYRRLVRQLEDILGVCSELLNQLEEARRNYKWKFTQSQYQESGRVTNMMMFLVVPFTVATGFFSMQSENPFFPANSGSFVLVLLIVTLTALLSYYVVAPVLERLRRTWKYHQQSLPIWNDSG